MRRLFTALVLLALLFSALPVSAQGPKSAGSNGERTYIVRMVEDPVVAYTGGIRGLKATKPNPGQKINPNSPDVVRYAAFLDSRHNAVLNSVGGHKLYDYRYSFNGFAAVLNEAQASKLAATAGVVSVSPDELLTLDTSSTPSFLGLSAEGGLWDQLGGTENAGEGVIIGIVDSGIWPEHPSLSDRTGNNGNETKDGKLNFQQIPGWHGKCTPGEEFTATDCNLKLIGAQWFNAGYGGDAGAKAAFPYEFISARDADGHGTHTATTAGGNYGVDAVVDGVSLGSISGMAPRARIASYKVCWGGDAGGCFSSDSVAAIDQAVADGVDVINFSISGSQTSFLDPVEVAFLFAADAGVFVAASAGNTGPNLGTAAHNSPWLTSVAAGTHERVYTASVTLGSGEFYSGVSLGTGTDVLPVILSTAAGVPGAKADDVRLCFPGALDPGAVTGKIVVCDRGVNARTEKSMVVQQAGGLGMILTNVSPSSLNADLHSVPTVHVDHIVGAAIKAYIASTPDATAQLSPGALVPNAEAPFVAAFSSRGPSRASLDLLKPDIMAPGVDVLAGVSPAGYNGRLFDLLSGTSMSSPHIAGLAALLKDKYPTWTPAMIKSALMTTASPLNNLGTPIRSEGGGPAGAFDYGSGQVVPNSAADPGLVYNAGFNDYLAFLCGTGQLTAAYCPSIAIDPSNLNYPSIAVGSLAGSKTIQRSVTNVSGAASTYNVSVQAPAGFDVTVTPASLTIQPGETRSYTVTITNATAALNTFTEGSLTWSDGVHSVRSPIMVRAVALRVPAEVKGTGSPISYPVTFGYTGAFSTAVSGLIPAATYAGIVVDDPTDEFVPTGPGVTTFTVSIPAGTPYARFSLFDDFTDGNDDLDLYVYLGNTQVGGSGSGTSAEEVNLVNPAAGDYTVYVHGWQTDGPDANFTLFTWVLGSASAGNTTVSAPASAVLGQSDTITLSFSGLAPATKYLGMVTYSGIPALSSYRTIVRVDTP